MVGSQKERVRAVVAANWVHPYHLPGTSHWRREFGLYADSPMHAPAKGALSLRRFRLDPGWSDITSGSPPKWSTDSGPNAAAIAVLTLLGASAALSAADVLEAKLRGVAMYCADNPAYLVNPVFDPTINIAGDRLA